MTLRVIQGGVAAGEPAPIVWNRLPIEAQRVALVIRNAALSGAQNRLDVAWDDGRPFLIGIRSIRDTNDPALEAWKALAVLVGCEIRDERSTPDVFAEADANNARAAVAARLEQERRARDARRAYQPPSAGGLFDEVRRNTQELF